MTRARNGSKPPQDGACRVHRLAPATAEDAFEYVAETLRDRGWTVIETGWCLGPRGGEYLMVDLWAIPPAKEPALAAGEAP